MSVPGLAQEPLGALAHLQSTEQPSLRTPLEPPSIALTRAQYVLRSRLELAGWADAQLMKWLLPRDFDSEIRNGRYCLRADPPAEAATAAKLPNYRLKVIVYRAARKTMPNGLSGSRSASRLDVGPSYGFSLSQFRWWSSADYNGWALFNACAGEAPAQLALTAVRMAELQQVNSYVNSTVTEVSDMEQYGREDVWTLPNSGKGDCEDFALLKRKLLIQRLASLGPVNLRWSDVPRRGTCSADCFHGSRRVRARQPDFLNPASLSDRPRVLFAPVRARLDFGFGRENRRANC